MNYETAAIIILFGSLIGLSVILIRKIPALKELLELAKKSTTQVIEKREDKAKASLIKKNLENGKHDNYWEEIKKLTKNKQ